MTTRLPIYNRASFTSGSDNLTLDEANLLYCPKVTTTIIVSGALTAGSENVIGNITAANGNITSNLLVNSNLTTTSANVVGNLNLNGNLTTNNTNVNVRSNLVVTGNLTSANAIVTSNLIASGNAYLNNGLAVNGTTYVNNGNLVCANSCSITGLLNVTGELQALASKFAMLSETMSACTTNSSNNYTLNLSNTAVQYLSTAPTGAMTVKLFNMNASSSKTNVYSLIYVNTNLEIPTTFLFYSDNGVTQDSSITPLLMNNSISMATATVSVLTICIVKCLSTNYALWNVVSYG
jgi:phage baseplate assembly protein gpV